MLPEDAFGDADTEQVAAALLLLVVCFLTGLALRTRTGNRILDWLEQKVLDPIPGYTVLRALSRSFSGDDKNEFFQPAVLNSPDGTRSPVLIVEEHAYSVMVPIAPTPAMGTIPIAPGNLCLCLCPYS